MRLLKSFSVVLLVILALSFNGYSGGKQSAPVSNGKQGITRERSLLFFMNPNGRPCQMQDEIISKIRVQLDSLVNVRYVKTTVVNDQAEFYKYGIRSIPLLILVDNSGKEVKRFTPGIHEQQSILVEINKQ